MNVAETIAAIKPHPRFAEAVAFIDAGNDEGLRALLAPSESEGCRYEFLPLRCQQSTEKLRIDRGKTPPQPHIEAIR